MPRSSPVLTATSAALRRAPVAKAFISSASKMPTSGMPMRACSGQARHRPHQPGLGVRLRLADHAHPHHALGGPLRQRQRDQRAAEAEHRREHQQAAEAALSQAHAEHLLDDEKHQAEQGQHGQIGDDEQENALHEAFLWDSAICYPAARSSGLVGLDFKRCPIDRHADRWSVR